ncbi:MAG: putative amidohydrolase, partial [Alphaproteobacteria bacterium]
MKIRSLQLNPIVGDIKGNALKLLDYCQQAAQENIDVVVTPECYLSGYPPEDLIFRPIFQQTIMDNIQWLAEKTKDLDVALILGTPRFENGHIYNAALWLYNGQVHFVCDKKCLPNYGTFDDKRLFSNGISSTIIKHKNVNFGVMICEDMWHSEPSAYLKENNADILISLNASPFEVDKLSKRL